MKQNKKTIFLLLLSVFSVTVQPLFSQIKVLTEKELLLPDKDMEWYKDAKFGMFIHWGLYSIVGKGEWVMFNKLMDVDKYAELSKQFEAKKFNADAWVSVAEEAGMKYMVLVTKHHDGFALWDSEASKDGFNSMNSAAHKDFVADYVTAARKKGLHVGLYYSPLDWRFPGFFFPTMYRASAEEMKAQTYGQIRELLTSYGKIDLLWYDGGGDDWLGLGGLESGGKQPGWHTRDKTKPYSGDFHWEPLKLNSMVRELQPKIVINPRSGWMGDFDTREKEDGGMQTDRPWERCYTISKGGWGWIPNAKVRSLDTLLTKFVGAVCKGGNFLLNVGPNAAGEIEPTQIERLKEMGRWLKVNGESIYSTRGGPIDFDDKWGGTTQKGNCIYVHVLHWPTDNHLEIPYTGNKILKATYLASGKKTIYSQTNNLISLTAPKEMQDSIVTVIKLQLK
jgi:alpha-L-fucosidase